ncbi:hypothetical protein RCO48_23245 [Peribacillus frigoritolerans]|nr:hypothetical protein [Peribacillus frigoritolerans]
MEQGVRDSCGNSESKGDPQAQVRRGRTARGKRVPVVEINVQNLKTNKKNRRHTRFSLSLSTVLTIL